GGRCAGSPAGGADGARHTLPRRAGRADRRAGRGTRAAAGGAPPRGRRLMGRVLEFTKMHGAGNDFIVLDGLAEPLPADLSALARRLADRHFGIGADQVLVLRPSATADVRMEIYDADGSQVEMCGN